MKLSITLDFASRKTKLKVLAAVATITLLAGGMAAYATFDLSASATVSITTTNVTDTATVTVVTAGATNAELLSVAFNNVECTVSGSGSEASCPNTTLAVTDEYSQTNTVVSTTPDGGTSLETGTASFVTNTAQTATLAIQIQNDGPVTISPTVNTNGEGVSVSPSTLSAAPLAPGGIATYSFDVTPMTNCPDGVCTNPAVISVAISG